eukprot:TRINITY_DN8997_c0_g1_i2.p1 TRINITY_DN8997_c0_g1~~TRINITY_DN8997_c0_g1_i2.p1  ORF type:complete len:887 (-),score=272.61 TRINITY_DN8997_c0_g1_i2:75-2735(-)
MAEEADAAPAAEAAAAPATEPAAVPSTEPAAVPATEPAAVPATEPAAVPATEPAAVPATEPAAIPAAAPAPEPAVVQPAGSPTAAPTKKAGAVFYIDAGTGGTRALLGRGTAGQIVVSKVGDDLAGPLKEQLLAGLQEQTEESTAKLLERCTAFAEVVKKSLQDALGVAGDGGIGSVLLGLTAWHRALPAADQEALKGAWDLLEIRARDVLGEAAAFQLLPLGGDVEAKYELRAVEYAAAKDSTLGLAHVDCVLGFGNGSLRFCCAAQHVAAASGSQTQCLDLSLTDGETMVASGGFGGWEAQCKAFCSTQLAAHAQWATGGGDATEATPKTLHIAVGGGTGILTATAAGLVPEGTQTCSVHAVVKVLDVLRTFAAKEDADARRRSDAARMAACLDALFQSPENAKWRDSCRIVFVGDVVLGGESLQVSWVAGHYLEYVASLPEQTETAPPAAAAEAAPGAEAAAPDEVAAAVASPKKQVAEASDAVSPASAKTPAGPENPDTAGAASQPASPKSAANASPKAESKVASPKAVPDPQPSAAEPGSAAVSPAAAKAPLSARKAPAAAAAAAVGAGDATGLVVYVVSPAASAEGEAALEAEEYRALSLASIRSGAAVVLSAPSADRVAKADEEARRVSEVFRPLAEFARSRYRQPGGAGKQNVEELRAFKQLFQALDANDSGTLGAREVASGLKSLGFPGDEQQAAEAFLVNAAGGSAAGRIERGRFLELVSEAAQTPEMVAVCSSQGGGELSWTAARVLPVGGGEEAGNAADVAAPEVLKAKTAEALRLAGGGAAAFGAVLVLASRARSVLAPAEYTRLMEIELAAVQESLPADWPILWCSAPAEVGLLPATKFKRPVWELPKTAGSHELLSWLRYLLVVRPPAPAG